MSLSLLGFKLLLTPYIIHDEEKINSLNNGSVPIYEPGLPELVSKNVAAGRLTFGTNLKNIINEAKERWKISAATIIHRIGKLEVGEGIVFVGTASSHRKDAFQSCDFIMDYLKTNAPLWKKERHDRGEDWVSSKESDQIFARSWKKGGD